MGRKPQQLNADVTVRIVQATDNAMQERWFRAMALLLDDKWGDPAQPGEMQACKPVDELTARLEMVCGIQPAP